MISQKQVGHGYGGCTDDVCFCNNKKSLNGLYFKS